MTEPAIELAGLTKSFGSSPVLRGISLRVAPGTVFGFVGPNGAGKSTTVKILVGLLDGFEGTARVAGVDLAEDPSEVKRRVGYVPENVAMYAALTVLEHLQLVGRLHELEEERIEPRALELLRSFDLEDRAYSRIGTLSKGMRQKVALSAALLHAPRVVFLDEPLAGLDVHSTILVKDLVRALADRGVTVFYCSHMMDVVERVCDEIVVIDEGKKVAQGSFEQLAAGAGGSLEDVFRRMTGGERVSLDVDRALRALFESTDPDESPS